MSFVAQHARLAPARPSLPASLDLGGIVLPILLLAAFTFASIVFRPLLAPDETRYLTVAWEMWLKHDFIVPTLNGALYDQKPPLLFWLIDLSWAIFGVSRAAATAAVFAISGSVVLLTRALAVEFWPERPRIAERIGWLMAGNVIFVIYSGLMLFDLLVTACISAALLAMLIHARAPRAHLPVIAGLAIGLSLIAKGPVALLFLAWPLLAYPLWRGERQVLGNGAFYRGVAVAFVVAALPALCWLVPLALRSGYPLIHDLIWGQAAGRISGKLISSHARPFWFYLPLLPGFALPWLALPALWFAFRTNRPASRGDIANLWRSSTNFRLLAPTLVLVTVIFSAISGKQPHYIVPLLPMIVLCLAWLMRNVPMLTIRNAAAATLAVALAGQAIASVTVFRAFDLSEVAGLASHWPEPVGVVGSYRGELGFIAQLKQPVGAVAPGEAAKWLQSHPGSLLLSLDRRRDETLGGRELYAKSYRGDRTIIAATAQ